MNQKQLIEIVERIGSTSKTLEHALARNRDLVLLVELSQELAQLCHQVSQEIVAELAHRLRQGDRRSDRQERSH
jgi:16S rRNA C1402 (ribose-2'-O) methylase RsmI